MLNNACHFHWSLRQFNVIYQYIHTKEGRILASSPETTCMYIKEQNSREFSRDYMYVHQRTEVSRVLPRIHICTSKNRTLSTLVPWILFLVWCNNQAIVRCVLLNKCHQPVIVKMSSHLIGTCRFKHENERIHPTNNRQRNHNNALCIA